jgi:signal transduction histidine kinase
MDIDIRTIILIIGIFRLIMILVFSYQYLAARSVKGPGWWLAWSVAETASSMVMLLRGVPELLPVAILLQNPIIVAGSVFILIGVLSFFEQKISPRTILVWFSFYYIIHIFFYLAVDDSNIRTILLYLGLLITTVLSLAVLFRNKTRSIAMTVNALSIILSLHGMIYIFRIIMITAGIESPTMFSSSPINFVIYFDALIVGLLLAFGFIILVNQRLNNEVVLAGEKLIQLNAEKDKFLSIVAHDLASPFNNILGLTDMMVEKNSGMTNDDYRKNAMLLNSSARRTFNLLQNLLQWSKLERGLIPFNPSEYKLVSLVNQSIAAIEESARAKKIEIITDISDDIIIFTDATAFGTILRNLASNAVKFTTAGGKIIISSVKSDGKMAEISVKDTGIGMSGEILSNLFRIDSQINRHGTEGEMSTGLGLIICKEFVEKGSGSLWATSEEGKGSEFCFTVPLSIEKR